MESHCPCCGVEFEGEYDEDKEDDGQFNYSYELIYSQNSIICLWCVENLHYAIVEVALGIRSSVDVDEKTYNSSDFKTFPTLQERINSLNTTTKDCPRCKNKLIIKESKGLFGETFQVLKCENCGWC